MIIQGKFIILVSLFITVIFLWGIPEITVAQDAGIEITPHVIDETAKARDLFKYTVKLKNNSKGKVTLYPMVNDISLEEGRQRVVSPDQLDRTESVARWIRISRGGIPLMPGDEKELELEINVSMYATPGKRYAVIGFPDGPNRYDADASMEDKAYAQIRINMDIVENIVEKAQIQLFKALRNVYLKFPVELETTIDNFGNRDIIPTGAIYIYNRKGVEEAKIEITSQAIAPDDKAVIISKWSPDKAFGKYKARIELEYGQVSKRDLQDTAFFWVLPLRWLIIFVSAFFIFVLILTFFIFRRTYNIGTDQSGLSRTADDGVIDLKKGPQH